jgi:hypothetical protein
MPIDFIVALLVVSIPLVALARRINVGRLPSGWAFRGASSR